MQEFQINVKIRKKGLTDEQIKDILGNIVEHIAQEREYWRDEGIIEDRGDIEPVVAETGKNKAIAKAVNEELREGYYFD